MKNMMTAQEEFDSLMTADEMQGLQAQGTAEASAEGTGEMIITDEDIKARLTSSTGMRDELIAHYQATVSHARTDLYERSQEVYYVENIDKGHGYEVVLSYTEDGGHRTATCECVGYVEHGRLCKHIVVSVQMERRRQTPRQKRALRAVTQQQEAA